MKRYETFKDDPVGLAEYITEKLGAAVQKVARLTGTRFYHSDSERAAVKGIILTELMEEVTND